MKSVYKLLICVFILASACSDDDQSNLSSSQLLIKHNWIFYSSVNPDGHIPDGEPEMMYHVLDFEKSGYSGSDYTGEFYNLGDWDLDDDILTMSGDHYPVIELTASKLVYESTDGMIVTRLAIKKGSAD